MRTWKILTIAILAIAAIALTTTSVFAFMGRPGNYTPYTTSPGTTGTTGTYVAPPSGTAPYGGYYGSYGGMMGGGWGCGGMMGRSGYGAPIYTSPTVATQLNISTAVVIAQNYVASTGNANLKVSQVEEYSLNFYVLVKEKDSGIGAFELLIDKYTGAVSPEMGPNMMWNTKYGMRSGMMGWLTGTTTAPATVTVDQAKADAQQYLNAYLPGTTAGDAQAFYGYYHIEVLSSGNVYGMLSVNSYTGQVWYHNWHGTFIQEVELS
jgi:hypothetical protein